MRVAFALAVGGGVGVAWTSLTPVPQLAAPIAVVAALSVSAQVLRLPSSPEAERYAAGARAERDTGAQLDRLRRAGWLSLHDLRIPGGKANIDHVVFGPGGVYIVETKRWAGTLALHGGQLFRRVRGRDDPAGRWLDEARREAVAVQQTLSAELADAGVGVQPILAVWGQAAPAEPLRVGGVVVVDGSQLAAWLARRPAVLGAHPVSVLHGLSAARLEAAGW